MPISFDPAYMGSTYEMARINILKHLGLKAPLIVGKREMLYKEIQFPIAT